ncbi:hypothetical protein KKE34_03590 [Patescibacteria group bacterium]|nr:hypothetical protein [Patescibacteria group bacterium]MBU1885665.1 hypothetical protein [Patescibacteria group bacterium]
MKTYRQKNRLLNYVFGAVWLILGSSKFFLISAEINIFSVAIYIVLIIIPAFIIPIIAIRNNLTLNTKNNTLIVRSLLHTYVIKISEIVDIKFPEYAPMHIKNRFIRALHDDDFSFTKCYVVTKNNSNGILIPFRSFGGNEFKSIIDLIKSINKNLFYIEYPLKSSLLQK